MRQLGSLGEANFKAAQIQGPKGLGSMPAALLYSAAGVCMQHFVILFRGRASLCLPRGQYNSWSKHFIIRSRLKFDTVSKKAFNLPLLPCLKTASSPAQKVLLLCIDFSPTSGGGKVGDLEDVLGDLELHRGCCP